MHSCGGARVGDLSPQARKFERVVRDGQRTGPPLEPVPPVEPVPVEPVPVEPVPVEPVPVEPVPVEPVPVEPVPVEPVPVDPVPVEPVPEGVEPFEWPFPDGPGLVACGTGNSGAVVRGGVGRIIGIVGAGEAGGAESPGSGAGGTNCGGFGFR